MVGEFGSASAVAFGCVVGIISSATQSIGLTLQRKSHIMEDEASANGARRPAHRQALWRIGLALFLLSNIFGSSVQITTLPLIVLSPLQAIGLVFNSICASVILSEPFSSHSIAGTLLVSLGALVIASFGVVPEPNRNLDELLVLLVRGKFMLWMAMTLVFCAILIFIIYKVVDEAGPEKPQWIATNTFVIRGALFGVLSGILSAHSLLMAKSAVELLVRGFSDRWVDFLRWQAWLIVGFFLFFALSQLFFLNNGLRLCSTSVLYPLVFCVYNVTVIMNGLIYFDQTSKLSKKQILMVGVGTMLVLIGVLSLSWRADSHDSQSTAEDNIDVSIIDEISENEPENRGQIYDNNRKYHSRSSSRVSTTMNETTPLIPKNRRMTNEDNTRYTSFSSNGGIPEPSSYSPNQRSSSAHVFGRNLSVEQSNLLQQLRKPSGNSMT